MRPGDDPKSLMTVPVGPGPGLEIGRPVVLFSGNGAFEDNSGYEQLPDGDFILLVNETPDVTRMPLIVVKNWIEELRRNVP